MSGAALAFQGAIYDLLAVDLAGDPVDGRIYDAPSQDATFPYVTIGDDTAIDFSTMTGDGEELTLTLHAWSRYPGRKEVKTILGAIKTSLHNQVLTVAGQNVVKVYFDGSETLQDQDGQTWHGVIRFRALTFDAA